MFERLVIEREKQFGKDTLRNGSLATLTTQRRMRPDIADLIRRTIYPTLLDSDVVKRYPDVRGTL